MMKLLVRIGLAIGLLIFTGYLLIPLALYFDLDPLDIPYCTLRVLACLWPCILLFSIWCIVTPRLKKRGITIGALAAILAMAALSANNVVTQWRLGLLISEDPATVDEAYAKLGSSLTSAQAWQIIKKKHEDANVRFALTVMLIERGETSLLNSVPIAPLKHPDFFGDDHLAMLARGFDYPVAVKDFIQGQRVADDPGIRVVDESFSERRDDWPNVKNR